nr:probable serine/threonine-protein kinase clkA [Ipomoea batatas]
MLVPDEINKAHKFIHELNFETHKAICVLGCRTLSKAYCGATNHYKDINLSSALLSEMGVFRTKCRVSREDSLVMVRVEVETNPRTLELVLVVALAQQIGTLVGHRVADVVVVLRAPPDLTRQSRHKGVAHCYGSVWSVAPSPHSFTLGAEFFHGPFCPRNVALSWGHFRKLTLSFLFLNPKP